MVILPVMSAGWKSQRKSTSATERGTSQVRVPRLASGNPGRIGARIAGSVAKVFCKFAIGAGDMHVVDGASIVGDVEGNGAPGRYRDLFGIESVVLHCDDDRSAHRPGTDVPPSWGVSLGGLRNPIRLRLPRRRRLQKRRR